MYELGRKIVSLLRGRIQELAKQHGSLRAAARVLQIDHGYLSRLQDGEKTEPSDDVLRKLGLRRVVTYVRRSKRELPQRDRNGT